MTEIARLLEAVEWRLAAARENAAQGGLPSLRGLEEEVRHLTRRLSRLPSSETTQLRPRLVSLLAELEAFADELRTALSEVAAAIREDRLRRTAHGAYRRGPAAES